ncbi:hypothetical protein BDP81DRAFT_416242 [Colletotrichum phormii]|uniref:Uncharacterized protein n=1 Tax=Colletotrichum phormii TaxID=359342 RepID=A0AAJ0A1C7_9PEZI|nr:uncharacterized protein BDP81DRAFT_416242 [Colletotrichum phormii]KAK1654658.1 hypothetical protein BDP81DRAFT_416242 [Colletotrichum phormii]
MNNYDKPMLARPSWTCNFLLVNGLEPGVIILFLSCFQHTAQMPYRFSPMSRACPPPSYHAFLVVFSFFLPRLTTTKSFLLTRRIYCRNSNQTRRNSIRGLLRGRTYPPTT